MATAIEAALEKRREQIDHNRTLGVVEYETPEPVSERVYEVEEGHKHLPGGIVLGPGQRFRPTEKQVRDGSLRGKASEITQTQYASLGRTRIQSTGADIGLRSLPMTNHALSLALDSGLSVEDFAGMEPASENGFTKAQVEDVVARKRG